MVKNIIGAVLILCLSPVGFASVQNDLQNYLTHFDTVNSKKEAGLFKQYARNYGLVIFYEANQKASQDMVNILNAFHSFYGFSVVGIAVNSSYLKSLPTNRLDEGQALHFGVVKTPSIFVVNPKTAKEVLVQIGSASEVQFRVNLQRALEKIHYSDEVTEIKKASPLTKIIGDQKR